MIADQTPDQTRKTKRLQGDGEGLVLRLVVWLRGVDLLESAGEGGFMVSGLTHSEGDGDLFSRFVGNPSKPFDCDIDSDR